MKIDVRNITQRKKDFILEYAADDLQDIEDIRFVDKLTIKVDAHQMGINSFILKCKGSAVQYLECSRTLKDFESPVAFQFEIHVKVDSKSKIETEGYNVDEVSDEAYEVAIKPQDDYFDITEMVRQEILLKEPMIPIDPNTSDKEWIESEELGEADGEDKPTDPRWDALKKLKIESKDSKK